MSAVPSTVKPPVAEPQPDRARAGAQWLVLGCYLLGAMVLTSRLWIDPAGRIQAGDPHDVDLFAWYMRYAATAVAHGHLPALVTTAMGAPRGVNLMWQTSFLLPGMVLTPVTLLAGPQVSLTVVLTLGLAGSAASLFWVLRRWGASVTAAALGGAVYGFSPALINSGIGHYHLVFAVLPPLMIDALLRILTGRGHPVLAGAWLGLLAGAQVFIGEELLADTAVACLVLAVVLAVQRPRAALSRAPVIALGLATSAAVALLICGPRPGGAVPRAVPGTQRAAGLVNQYRLFRGPARHAAVPHAGQRGRHRQLRSGDTGGPGLPGLAAAGRARLLHDPLLAGSAGPHRGADLRGAGSVQPRRRQPAVPAREVPAVALAAAAARRSPTCCRTGSPSSPTARLPPCSPSRWTWRARGRRPGAAGGEA